MNFLIGGVIGVLYLAGTGFLAYNLTDNDEGFLVAWITSIVIAIALAIMLQAVLALTGNY